MYMERTRAYQRRIESLRSAKGLEESEGEGNNDPVHTSTDNGGPKVLPSLKATYGELVLVEKPQVGIEDVEQNSKISESKIVMGQRKSKRSQNGV